MKKETKEKCEVCGCSDNNPCKGGCSWERPNLCSKCVSKNKGVEDIFGLREEYLPPNAHIFDFPCELGYHCPVCKYEPIIDGNYDERLEWSEYSCFIWCSVCNKDYPSALCMPDIERAVDIYLTSTKEAINRAKKIPRNEFEKKNLTPQNE